MKNAKQILALALAFCLLCGLIPGISSTAMAAESDGVSDLRAQIEAKKHQGGTITLDKTSYETDTEITIPASDAGGAWIIEAPDGKRTSFKASADATTGFHGNAVFSVAPGANVTFRNITIDGNNVTRGIAMTNDAADITLDSVTRQGDGSSVLLVVVGKHAGFHAPGRCGQQGRFFCRIGPDKKNRPSVLRWVGRVQQPSEGLGDCPVCRAPSDSGTVPLSAAAGFHPP